MFMIEIIICVVLFLLRGFRDSFLYQANDSLKRCRTSGGRPIGSPLFFSVCPKEDEYLMVKNKCYLRIIYFVYTVIRLISIWTEKK